MKIGIVVLNYCTWQATIDCVESIIATYRGEKEIIVVDNCSPNDSHKKLCEYFAEDKYREVQCVCTDRNGGFAYGNNVGINICKMHGLDYAVVTNNDVIFLEHTIEQLLNDFLSDEKMVMVAPQLLNQEYEVITLPWKKRQSLAQFLGLRSAGKLIYRQEELQKLTRVCMVSGCCFMIDIRKFIHMGAIDEGTFLYMEEGTMSIAAERKNYSIYYDPEVKVIHAHGASTGRRSLFVDQHILISGLYYWKEYEHASNIQLCFIYGVMVLQTAVKVLIGKRNPKGLKLYLNRVTEQLLSVLK